MDDSSSQSSDELFNPSDFIPIKLKVLFKNITSQLNLPEDSPIQLSEFADHALILELPEASCNLGHQVYLEVYNITQGVDSSHPILRATGKVKGIEGLPEKKLRVTIDLVQFEEKNWQSLIEIFSKRQREIIRFLEQVKG